MAATAQVVLEAPPGRTVAGGAAGAQVAATVDRLRTLNGVVAVTDPLDPASPAVSADKRAAYATVTYGVQPPEITYTQRAALIGAVQAARDGGLTAEVAGQASGRRSDVGGAAELIGVVAALVVLAGHLRLAGRGRDEPADRDAPAWPSARWASPR